MRDVDLVHQRDGAYVIVLQDGTQLDGTLQRYDACFAVGSTPFAAYEVDDLLDDLGGWLEPVTSGRHDREASGAAAALAAALQRPAARSSGGPP